LVETVEHRRHRRGGARGRPRALIDKLEVAPDPVLGGDVESALSSVNCVLGPLQQIPVSMHADPGLAAGRYDDVDVEDLAGHAADLPVVHLEFSMRVKAAPVERADWRVASLQGTRCRTEWEFPCGTLRTRHR
jgi:hypothetical protein